MPIGEPGWVQELVKVTKQDQTGILKQENLGAVRFVPLIGEEGWSMLELELDAAACRVSFSTCAKASLAETFAKR